MGLTPLAFTGLSTFSADFQTILDRALKIAKLPIERLQNEQTDLLSRKQLLSELRDAAADFAFSISNLGEIAQAGSLDVAVSNPALLSASSDSSASAGVYIIGNVTSLATPATAISTSGYASPTATQVSSGNQVLQLAVGASTYDLSITPAQDNLAGVRDAINAADAGVTASILYTGSNYFLSIAAQSSGAQAIELRTVPGNSGSNLLTSSSPGSSAQFEINGQTVTTEDNVVSSVVPGVTFTLLDTTAPGETVNMSLAPSRSKLVTALEEFVTTYNALQAGLNAQIGETAGLLTGNSLVSGLQSELRKVTGLQGSGSIKDLAALGIELDVSGEMQLSSGVVSAFTSAQLESALSLIGSTTTGLASFASNFTSYSDPLNGLIRIEQAGYDDTDVRLTYQIGVLSERVNNLQVSLFSRLQAADALLAGLDSQQKVLAASIESLSLATFGRNDR